MYHTSDQPESRLCGLVDARPDPAGMGEMLLHDLHRDLRVSLHQRIQEHIVFAGRSHQSLRADRLVQPVQPALVTERAGDLEQPLIAQARQYPEVELTVEAQESVDVTRRGRPFDRMHQLAQTLRLTDQPSL